MLFNSLEFGLFALVFFFVYFLVYRWSRVRSLWILACSLFFYGWWSWWYLLLLLLSGGIDFCSGLYIYAYPRHKKWALYLSLTSNLGLLFLFKYLDWVVNVINNYLLLFSGQSDLLRTPAAFALLPVGISFYTFQSMSYTLDIYRQKLKPTRSPILFFTYLAMFPQLVAGPIVRAKVLLEDLRQPSWDYSSAYAGLRRVAFGLFKKVVIADTLSTFVDHAFSGSYHAGGFFFWWAATLAFAVQIYCDFSGYSDIAIGLALWMGVKFPENFNHPYLAKSLKDFWGRWHISLSTWFRDYVYIPLGGNKGSEKRVAINLWITMLLSGLWHGAAGHFVIWGAVHAGALSLEKRWAYLQNRGFAFLVVMLGWVFFRCEDLSQALAICFKLLDITQMNVTDLHRIPLSCFVILAGYGAAEVLYTHRSRWSLAHRKKMERVCIATALTICMFYRGDGGAFIYFQF